MASSRGIFRNVNILHEFNAGTGTQAIEVYQPGWLNSLDIVNNAKYSGFITSLRLTIDISSIDPMNIVESDLLDGNETVSRNNKETFNYNAKKCLSFYMKTANTPLIKIADAFLFNQRPYYYLDLINYFTSAGTFPDRDTGLGKPNNLPQRQDSLRNDGQYRTTDVTPETTAKAPPSKQSNQVTARSATDDAINQAVYYGGFFATGVIDAINENFVNDKHYEAPLGIGEDLAFKLGKRTTKEAIDLVNDGIKNGEKLLDDLWRNKPTFEIPQIKIPKFDLPELPDLTPPKFPDFKFPEISFPKPEPPKQKEPKPIPRPKPPPKPSPNKWTHEFYIGEYDCYAFVAVGFYKSKYKGTNILDIRPGAGIFSWKFNGTPAPPGMEENFSGSESSGSYFPDKDPDIAMFANTGRIGETGTIGTVWYTDFFLSPGQQPKIGERAGAYKKVNVVPVRCHYFSKGQKDNIPDWSLGLREKDSNKK